MENIAGSAAGLAVTPLGNQAIEKWKASRSAKGPTEIIGKSDVGPGSEVASDIAAKAAASSGSVGEGAMAEGEASSVAAEAADSRSSISCSS